MTSQLSQQRSGAITHWRRSLCPKLGGIDPEKPYRAPSNTLIKDFPTLSYCWFARVARRHFSPLGTKLYFLVNSPRNSPHSLIYKLKSQKAPVRRTEYPLMDREWLPGFSCTQTASTLSFSSDLVRGVHARVSVERLSHETRETRAAVSLPSRAWSMACLGGFA